MPASPGSPGSVDDRVLHVLRARGPMTPADIAKALSLDRFPVHNALHRLWKRGLVRVAGMVDERGPQWGGGGRPSIWEAVPAD